MSWYPLQGRTAIVTGASSGLGKEIVNELVKRNVKVFALARSISKVDFPQEVTKIPVDIRNGDSITTALQEIGETKIDFLINCAGRGLVKELEVTTDEEIEDVLATNLKGVILITQKVYSHMVKQSGHIINIVSTSGIKARPDEPIYCASKWGLRGFTESLRLSAAKHSIRVTGVYPGGMKTDFWKGEEPRDTSSYMDPVDIAKEVVHILETPSTIAPSEYIIERGFGY